MSGRARRLRLFAVVGVILVIAVAGLVVVGLSRHRTELEGFVGLAITVATIAATLITWVLRHKSGPGSEVVSGQELGRQADLLAGAVDAEWKRAAEEWRLLESEPIPVRWQRPAAPFAGPVAAAVASTRFAPLPGLAATRVQQLQAGQVSELHEVYGGLGSGRLVIAGGPGSGKTSAAVLLILAALRYRQSFPEEVRPGVPVPVMFTLQGWDPGTQRAGDWLADRLWRTYPLFPGKGAARGMLEKGRIAVILDGLDEIPEDLRPIALQALSQQANNFRLVLLTRSGEIAAAAARSLLQDAAAVELQDIDPVTAATYLTRTQLDPPPPGWQELTSQLRQDPGGPLAHALSSPLMLTLVRDTCRTGDDVSELLGLRDAAGHPASSEDIADHLLDRVLSAAYTQQPGAPSPRYDLPTAERALRRLAARMNKDGIRDLQWWHVPDWAHSAPLLIATLLGIGLVVGLVAGLRVGLAFGLEAVYVVGLGTLLGIVFSLPPVALLLENKTAKRAAPMSQQLFPRRGRLVVGLLTGLACGWATWMTAANALRRGAGFTFWRGAGFTFWRGPGVAFGLWVALAFSLVAGLVIWRAGWPVGETSQPWTDHASPLSPLSSWRSDRAFGLWAGLTTGLTTGLVVELGVWFGTKLEGGLVAGIVAGLGAGLVAGLMYSQSWQSSLAFAQLAASDRTPVRLMRFLEDARSRRVLRTVGPVYQFRHARLQDRLAAREPEVGQSPCEPCLAAEDAAAPTAKAPPESAI